MYKENTDINFNTETKKQLSSCHCIELNGVPEIETLLLLTALSVMIWLNTGCPRRNVPDIRRVFLMLKYTDITQNTYIQS
jgi:hypothetical protein